MTLVFHQPDMEQTLLADVKRHQQRLSVESPLLNVHHSMFHIQCKRFLLYHLHRITFSTHLYTREQRRMNRYGLLNSRLQLTFVQTAIQHKQIWQVVAQFSLMCNAFGIDAMLHF